MSVHLSDLDLDGRGQDWGWGSEKIFSNGMVFRAKSVIVVSSEKSQF